MRPEKKKRWIVLSPVDAFVCLAVMVLVVMLAFGLGVYYGGGTVEESDQVHVSEQDAMAYIDDYLKNNAQSFHLQQVLDSDNPEKKHYLYTLKEDKRLQQGAETLKRLSPGDSLAEAPATPPIAPIAAPVPETPTAVPSDIPKEGYVIQVESFEEEARAKKKEAILKGKGFPTLIDVRQGDILPYRLLVGPYPSKEEAQAHLSELRKLTRPDAFIVKYTPKAPDPVSLD